MAKKPTAGKAKPKAKAAAGKKKSGGRSVRNAAGATAKATVKHEAKQISPGDFERLVKRTTSLKKQAKEISGSMGEMVAAAVADKHLDKPAFDIYRKLFNMSPQKRRTTLACFDFYRDLEVDRKKLDSDETGQGELDIPRQETGQKEPKANAAAPKNGTGEKKGDDDGTVVDLRPPHLRTPAEGGTKAVEDIAKAAGAQTSH